MGHLFLGLKSIKMKDSSKHRVILFQNYIDTSFLYQLILKNPFIQTRFYQKLISYLFSFYALLNTLKVSLDFKSHHQFITIYEHNNEIRCIKARLSNEQFSHSGFITFSKTINFWVLKQFLGHIRFSFRLFRLGAKLIQKNGILIGTRQSQFLFFYSLTGKITKQASVPLIISTESNPNVIGIALAAQKHGHKIIYINHGFLDSDLGLFFHNQVVAQGDALIDRIKPFISSNPLISNVGAYYPVQALKIPVSKVQVVGIVLSLNPVESKIINLIKQIGSIHPEVRIEIRPHPNLIFSSELTQNLRANSKISVLAPTDWLNFHTDWDLAIAGNTSAHIDLIAKGIPCIGMNIDQNPEDIYGFYKDQFILKTDYHHNIHQDLNDFYNNEEWHQKKLTYLPSLGATIQVDTKSLERKDL
jgi:hypothetical protein